jgi:hypothetical protein
LLYWCFTGTKVQILTQELQGNSRLLLDQGIYSTLDKALQGFILLGASGSGKGSLMASVI